MSGLRARANLREALELGFQLLDALFEPGATPSLVDRFVYGEHVARLDATTSRTVAAADMAHTHMTGEDFLPEPSQMIELSRDLGRRT